jgi:hypothetical protein
MMDFLLSPLSRRGELVRRSHPSLRRAAAVLAAAATATVSPALTTAAGAAGETAPPPVQDVRTFCTNPYAAQFTDVPASHTFELAIRCVATAGIAFGGANGQATDRYAPETGVNRGQMASFVARLVAAADARDRNRSGATFGSQIRQLPADDRTQRFADVPTDHPHAASINRLSQAGVVEGSGSGGEAGTATYSPDAPVTRAQMATFLNRAVAYALGQDPASAGAGAGYTAPDGADYYADDETATAHEANINGVTSVGIAVGSTPDRYVPGGTVTRGQMAGFLARTLSQLFDDDRIHSLLETYTGHFTPDSRADAQRQVSRQGQAEDLAVNVRQLTAGFLGPLEYRITLVRCENVTRGADDLVRVTPDGSTGFANAGAPTTRIVSVGDTNAQQPAPAGTTNSIAARPSENGSIRIRVRNDSAPECVVAVLYVNGAEGKSLGEGGSSPRLEVDSTGLPRERFGVSGATQFAAAAGTTAG